MNPKVEKITREIDNLQSRIANDQERLKDLRRQKIDLENTEIIVLFRSVDVAPAELAAFIEKFKKQSAGALTPINNTAAESYRPAPVITEEDTDE